MLRISFAATALVAAAALVGAAAASTYLNWKGPGWYEIDVDVDDEYTIVDGPFADESTCAAEAHRDDAADDSPEHLYCSYIPNND